MAFAFLCNILIVNLLIAQMTSAYENVRQASSQHRLRHLAFLAIEYTNQRSMLPLWADVILLNLLLRMCCLEPRTLLHRGSEVNEKACFEDRSNAIGFKTAIHEREWMALNQDVRLHRTHTIRRRLGGKMGEQQDLSVES